jgi:hypothetical protein
VTQQSERASPARDGLFRQARERGDIAQLSGVPIGRRGRCPLCGEGRKRDTAFAHNRNGTWRCWRGCGGGDAITLVAQMKGFTLVEAARDILGLPVDGSHDASIRPESEAQRRKREQEAEERRRKAARSRQASARYHAEVIAGLDAGSRPASDSNRVAAWLSKARGLPVDLLADAMARLRSCPRALYQEDFETGEIHRHPAMVAIIEDCVSGDTVGRHATYLSRSGLSKADIDAPRKVWGSNRGGVWLTGRDAGLGPLFVGEGIETALSMLADWRLANGARSGRALAVLSLDNLQGGWLTDRYGRIDPDLPRFDHDRPAIAWPNMGRVIIGVDHDMKPLEVKVRKPQGGMQFRMLSATQRMEICARLASFWWRRAGGNEVFVARPALGMDWNDEWLSATRRAA